MSKYSHFILSKYIREYEIVICICKIKYKDKLQNLLELCKNIEGNIKISYKGLEALRR